MSVVLLYTTTSHYLRIPPQCDPATAGRLAASGREHSVHTPSPVAVNRHRLITRHRCLRHRIVGPTARSAAPSIAREGCFCFLLEPQVAIGFRFQINVKQDNYIFLKYWSTNSYQRKCKPTRERYFFSVISAFLGKWKLNAHSDRLTFWQYIMLHFISWTLTSAQQKTHSTRYSFCCGV